MIRVVVKNPGLPAEVVLVENTLESFQKLLHGGYLGHIRLNSDVYGYCDDEGLLKELPVNFILDGDPICGPVFFFKIKGEVEVGFEDEAEAMALCSALNGLPTGKDREG